MTAIHFSEAEARKLGILPAESTSVTYNASAPEPFHMPAHTAQESPTQAAAALFQPVMPTAKPTPTYEALAGILAAARAFYGDGALHQVPGGFAIRVSEQIAVGVDITQPQATVISWHVRSPQSGKWRKLEARSMPRLTPHELLTLFVLGKD